MGKDSQHPPMIVGGGPKLELREDVRDVGFDRLSSHRQPIPDCYGEIADVEARLRDAERWLETTADTGERPETGATAMVVVDEEAFRRSSYDRTAACPALVAWPG